VIAAVTAGLGGGYLAANIANTPSGVSKLERRMSSEPISVAAAPAQPSPREVTTSPTSPPAHEPPKAEVTATPSDAVIATMPGAVFLEVLHNHPEVSMYVLKLLATRVRELDNRVLEYSTLDVRHRVSCELLRLARPDAKDSRRGVLAPVPTQAEIAARVSTTREAVVREMKLLEREGYLQRQRGALVLVDMPNLVQRLETED